MQTESSNPPSVLNTQNSEQNSNSFPIKSEISKIISDINSHLFQDKYLVNEEESLVDLLKKIKDFFINNDLVQKLEESETLNHELTVKYNSAVSTIKSLLENCKSNSVTPRSLGGDDFQDPSPDVMAMNLNNINDFFVDYEKLKEDYLKSLSTIRLYESQLSNYPTLEGNLIKEQEKNEKLSTSFNELKDRYYILENKFNHKEKVYSNLLNENNELQTNSKNYKNMISILELEKHKLTVSDNEQGEKIKIYENKISDYIKEIEQLRTNVQNLTSKIDDINRENSIIISQLKEKIKQYEEESIELKEQIKDSNTKNLGDLLKDVSQSDFSFQFNKSKNNVQIRYISNIIGEVPCSTNRSNRSSIDKDITNVFLSNTNSKSKRDSKICNDYVANCKKLFDMITTKNNANNLLKKSSQNPFQQDTENMYTHRKIPSNGTISMSYDKTSYKMNELISCGKSSSCAKVLNSRIVFRDNTMRSNNRTRSRKKIPKIKTIKIDECSDLMTSDRNHQISNFNANQLFDSKDNFNFAKFKCVDIINGDRFSFYANSDEIKMDLKMYDNFEVVNVYTGSYIRENYKGKKGDCLESCFIF